MECVVCTSANDFSLFKQVSHLSFQISFDCVTKLILISIPAIQKDSNEKS